MFLAEKKSFKLVFILLLIVITSLACTLGTVASPQPTSAPTQDVNSMVSTSLAQTQTAQAQIVVPQQVFTQVITPGLPVFTQVVIPTSAALPSVTTIINANCRSGPDSAYSLVNVMLLGETATIDGKLNDGSWFHVVPANGKPACWLIKSSVTVSGDISKVTVMAAPPAPTVALLTNLIIKVGQTMNGKTTVAQPFQYWAFYGTKGDSLLIWMTGNFDPFFYVYYDSLSHRILGMDDCGSGNYRDACAKLVLENTGWYYIEATGYDIIPGNWDYNGAPDVGEYTLSLTQN
jgi:hypothetical protein